MLATSGSFPATSICPSGRTDRHGWRAAFKLNTPVSGLWSHVVDIAARVFQFIQPWPWGDHESVLRARARSSTAPHRDEIRARIVLAAAEGAANTEVAAAVGVHIDTVRKWRR